MTERTQTQRITQIDIQHGRIRIPTGQKGPFPDQVERVAIRIKGVRLDDVAWNPRLGPIRERSGVLQIGSRLRDIVEPDERLATENLGDEIVLG